MFEKSARKAATRVYIRDMWTLPLVKRTMSVNNTEWLWGRGRTNTKQKKNQKEYNTFARDFKHPFSLRYEQNPGYALAEAT